ncbi:p53-like transcription factor, partial [Basidiobolus meristosporus CBS 931.73]
MSYGAPSFHPTLRKRRSDSLGFPNEAGPYFTQTKQHYNLYSMDKTNSYSIRVDSKFDRGFFLADNDWTCYRRNYFQVSTAFSLIGSNHPPSDPECPCIVDVDGVQHTVVQFSLGVTARVSNSDKKIDLIQHTPKRDKGPQTTPAARPIRAGGNVNLSSVGSNQTIVTFERIQFKTATANNGKRRAAQQYYVLVVELLAECDNGEQYKVASTQSAPLVVRGRSPGHYADSHERFNPMVNGPSSDSRYFSPHRMSADMGSPYTNFAPYAPFPAQSPSQMMMTP